MGAEKVLVVDEDGETLTGLYSDELVKLGTIQGVTRASNVEYGITPGVRGWEVELSQDPRLGDRRGFILVDGHALHPALARGLARSGEYIGSSTRAEALAAEVRWLNQNILKG
jgi:hypothetical protein